MSTLPIYKCKGCGKALTKHERDYHLCQGRELPPCKEHPIYPPDAGVKGQNAQA